MRRGLFFSIAIAGLAVLLSALPALAQSTYKDSANGNETNATSTEGWFSGNATGQLPGSWSADIVHTPLANCQSYCLAATITGGSFTLKASSMTVNGTFASGSVYQTSGFSGCTNQTYNVRGQLTKVGPGGGTGTGTFNAILTHYRFPFFWFCITYGATVKPPTNAPNVTLTF